jgi:hypothetical protein
MPKIRFERLENLISGLDDYDRKVLEKACEILFEVQMEFGNHMELQNIDTGEIMKVSELSRVRGILSMLAEAHTLQMSIK